MPKLVSKSFRRWTSNWIKCWTHHSTHHIAAAQHKRSCQRKYIFLSRGYTMRPTLERILRPVLAFKARVTRCDICWTQCWNKCVCQRKLKSKVNFWPQLNIHNSCVAGLANVKTYCLQCWKHFNDFGHRPTGSQICSSANVGHLTWIIHPVIRATHTMCHIYMCPNWKH